MTSFFLLLGKLFQWSFAFFDRMGFWLNWLLFAVACLFFLYWCYILVVRLGGNKDKAYHSDTEGKNPYYREDLYSDL